MSFPMGLCGGDCEELASVVLGITNMSLDCFVPGRCRISTFALKLIDAHGVRGLQAGFVVVH